MAGAVLGAHVVLLYALWRMSGPSPVDETAAPPAVIATLFFDEPAELPQAPEPLHVEIQKAPQLQIDAPKVPDIVVEQPEPVVVTEPAAIANSAPVAQQADEGLAGNAPDSSGHSGGGRSRVLLHRVIPPYPAASIRLGEQGLTAVMLHVDEGGRVTAIKVTHGSGFKRLDEAAMKAFRKWKFAPAPAGSAPAGNWVITDQRFVLYQFEYARPVGGNTARVSVEMQKSGELEDPTPGSTEALRHFIEDLHAGNFKPYATSGEVLAKLRAALDGWGEVQSIHFTGVASTERWVAYGAGPEVTWGTFEVHHPGAISEWLIAMDRSGMIWNVQAGEAPWK